jgi:hypothetical protein
MLGLVCRCELKSGILFEVFLEISRISKFGTCGITAVSREPREVDFQPKIDIQRNAGISDRARMLVPLNDHREFRG